MYGNTPSKHINEDLSVNDGEYQEIAAFSIVFITSTKQLIEQA